MRVVKDTPFEVGWSVVPVRAPQWALSVVVKATFALVHGGACPVAEKQRPLGGDQYADDDITRELRGAMEVGPPKPRGECLVIGACHRPPGSPEGVSGVAFRVGRIQKSVAVFGARRWARRLGVWLPSEPEAFASMPLTWDRAFGGPDVKENPVGIGAVPRGVDPSRVPLPAIERPDQLMQSPDQRPEPIGVSPVSPWWAPRQRLLASGTVALGPKARFIPDDFDWDYFMSAPRDQWNDSFWRGDEEIVLRHLRPEQALIHTHLPGMTVRVVASQGGRDSVVPMQLDTITLDADGGCILGLWRGLVAVADREAADVTTLFVCHESINEGRTLDALTQRRAAVIAAEDGEEAEEVAEALIRPPLPTAPGLAVAGFAAALAGGAALASLDLTALDAPGVDLRGRDLKGVILNGAQLAGANLAGADLEAAVLVNADLRGADLSGAKLIGADLTFANLAGANLSDANLTDVVAGGIDCTGANLARANLGDGDFTEGNFSRATLDGARLDKAEFTRGSFVDAHLENASLKDTTVDAADLSRAFFIGASLQKLRASGRPAVFTGALLRKVDLEGAKLIGATLDGIDAEEAIFRSADLDGASLVGAHLHKTNFVEAKFRGANLRRAACVAADFREATLDGADLREADFRGANLFGVVGEDTQRAGMMLTGAQTERSGFGGASS